MMKNRQMASVTEPLCSYRYDSLDRLTDILSNTEPTTRRFYQHGRASTDVTHHGASSIFFCTHQPLALQQLHNDLSSTSLLATDRQATSLHVINEGCLNNWKYTPYGFSHLPPGLPGFNGEHVDPVTGYYLLGNYRTFNPTLMRFNSPDNTSPFERGGLNAYVYCNADPINKSDPTGHSPLSILKKLGRSIRYFNELARPGLQESISNFKQLSPDVIAFVSYSKKQGKTLNISGHGGFHSKENTGFIELIENKQHATGATMGELLKEYYNLNEFQIIRTIVCEPGKGGERSLAAGIAESTGLTVKAFKNRVGVTGIKNREMQKIIDGNTSAILLMKSRQSYSPKYFYSSASANELRGGTSP